MSIIYYFNWNNVGDYYFFIMLIYNFVVGLDMDYFIYYFCILGLNGNFKEVEICVKLNVNIRGIDEWNMVMIKNFGGMNVVVCVNFLKV